MSGEPGDFDPPRAAVAEAVARALAEDIGPLGDLSAALVDPGATAHLVMVARAEGVIAGRLCAEQAFLQVDPALSVCWRRPDGSAVRPGDTVAEVHGALAPMLTAERTALNFVGHLSGVATLTRRFVEAARSANPAVRILDTRKTTPGLRALEKAAVRAGGGHNHRAGLSDAVLVKDNHLGALTVTDAVARARARWPGRLVEIECDALVQVEEACRAGAGAVLLDNMSPSEATACVTTARLIDPTVLIEVSGGMTLETVGGYAASGVDCISVGALTHSVPVLDLGLDLLRDNHVKGADGAPRH